jgi:hypothetical protein
VQLKLMSKGHGGSDSMLVTGPNADGCAIVWLNYERVGIYDNPAFFFVLEPDDIQKLKEFLFA